MTSVDGDGHGSNGGHGLLQGALVASGDVDEAGVIGGVVLGVVMAFSILRKEEEKKTPP